MKLDIHIQHLGFAVYVRPVPKDLGTYASTFFAKDGYSVKLYLPDNCSPSAVAHELTHALQQICRRYNIDFRNEDEHMGYLMQWMMEKILDAQRKQRKAKRKKR